MPNEPIGQILSGETDVIRRSHERWLGQPVDMEWPDKGDTVRPARETTLAGVFSVAGPGTFLGQAQRVLHFAPSTRQGWWFDRTDLPDCLPIRASVDNVWTTVLNIVLASGSPRNYMRMVEHIVALRTGLDLDNVSISVDSGDPPLFDDSSLGLVQLAEKVGIAETGTVPTYVTVKEPVTVGGRGGSFLTFLPPEDGRHALWVDCAVDFRTAIGRQRIVFPVNRESFRHGALARTNCTFAMMLYSKTVGRLFADVRNLGYTTRNILVAGRYGYYNKPRLFHNGKSLEAAWHRATLDLLAAVALIDKGRLAGRIVSYKAGHGLDVAMVRQLYERDLLCRV
jgi:UDP-3-O-acyl-N-acetylglucosamine deacetylase